MIIPIRCFTCGKPVGQLWESYQAQIAKGVDPKEAMDKLELERMCCRSLFLTHEDLVKRAAKFKK